MAGAGYTLFNTGDVLTAGQVNNYLQEQTVMRFANATARTTALSGVLAEGMVSYLDDINAVQVYNGSAWVNVGEAGDITAVTAGIGISGGGTSGDVTVTNSMATAIDAKGDLIAGTADNSFSRLAVGNNGETLVADSSTSTGLRWQQPKTQNALYNSSFDIWQRGTSFNGSAPYYCADRWFFARPGAAAGSTVSRQSAGLTGFNYCARMQRDNGNTSTSGVRLFQSLETADSIYFAGKTVTLSFYVRSGANYSGGNGTYINLYSGTGTDQQLGNTGFTGAASIALSSPITPTSTWTRYSVTGTVSSSATEIGFEIGYNPTGTAGANDYIEVTGFQLEVGSVATPYTRQNVTLAGELAACMRYYERFTALTTNPRFGAGIAVSGTVFNPTIYFTVPKRASANVIDWANLTSYDSAVRNITSVAFSESNSNCVSLAVNVASGLTTGRTTELIALQAGSFIGFSAEL